MPNQRATPDLDRNDLPGSAFLIAADRKARGLEPLKVEALARAARLYHHRVEVDRFRREAGRVRTREDGTETAGTGVRTGLVPVGASDGTETTDIPHAQHTEPQPDRVAEAADILHRVNLLLDPLDHLALVLKAQGYEGLGLLMAFGRAVPETEDGARALADAKRWRDLDARARRSVTRRIRGRLQRARDTLDKAMAEGGVLAGLKREGYFTRRNRGGAR
jgi:hypothetical protein